MKDLILLLFSRNLTLKISRNFNMCHIEVKSYDANPKIYTCEQVIPIDHHLNDESLVRCIKYCVDSIESMRLVDKLKEEA